MDERKLNIKQAHKLRVSLDDLENALTGKGFLPELGADVLQNGLMRVVVLVQEVLERQVRRAQTVEEVLTEDPAAISVMAHDIRTRERTKV